ncbi:MAG TPA: winged helix DNA-binding domain-containing protein [Pyrinomonadaceae bacterium]|nr:winged helix DNA-binding domain-containing protein [Pyrinomonadaceae bacterium]
MNKSDIAKIRLFNQQITATKFTKPEEIVAWFGAMQAQDYPSAKWAIGLRIPDAAEEKIEKAIEDGKILRTHLMRPTWHFAAGQDIRWLIALSAPQLRSTSAAPFRQFGLDAEICKRSNDLIIKALEGGNHLTRSEIMTELKDAGIDSDNYRASYLMFNAEIDGLVCNGVKRGKLQTYALLDERVPKTAAISRDEAIAELTRRYFTSHAPATLKDFIWWSGLPTGDARKGLEMNKSNLVSEEIEGQTYYLPDSFSIPTDEPDSLHLLPAFDEFMVAYKDRSASLEPTRAKEGITGNGIFKPIIVVDGKIRGVWKRSYKKDSLVIEKILFGELNDSETQIFRSKAQKYGDYEGKNVQIV